MIGTISNSVYKPDLEGVPIISDSHIRLMTVTKNKIIRIRELSNMCNTILNHLQMILPLGNLTQLNSDNCEDSIATNFTNQLPPVQGPSQNVHFKKPIQTREMIFNESARSDLETDFKHV